jgi:regulator of protease activity HflC (stomatin/prohibitin superfamily)
MRVLALTRRVGALRAGHSSLLEANRWRLHIPVAMYSSDRRRKTRTNTGLIFVPHQQAWIVERFGKFNRIMAPGFNICIPLVERISYVQSLKEVALDIPHQSAITLDNVTLQIDGVLYFRVLDPYKASYGIEDHEYAVIQLAQTTMRSELGKISLDNVFQERTSLNAHIVGMCPCAF